MLVHPSVVCAENYYRQRNTRCAACPTNSIRPLNENDELCPCINGYGRRQEADIDQPCMCKMQRNTIESEDNYGYFGLFSAVVGFNMERVTFSEGAETHIEVVHLALSTSSNDEITVTFIIYPNTYTGLVSQQVTFTRGATTAVC